MMTVDDQLAQRQISVLIIRNERRSIEHQRIVNVFNLELIGRYGVWTEFCCLIADSDKVENPHNLC